MYVNRCILYTGIHNWHHAVMINSCLCTCVCLYVCVTVVCECAFECACVCIRLVLFFFGPYSPVLWATWEPCGPAYLRWLALHGGMGTIDQSCTYSMMLCMLVHV